MQNVCLLMLRKINTYTVTPSCFHLANSIYIITQRGFIMSMPMSNVEFRYLINQKYYKNQSQTYDHRKHSNVVGIIM